MSDGGQDRGIFLALPLGLLFLLGLRNNSTLAPMWLRSVVAVIVVLPTSPALRWLTGKIIRIAVGLAVITGIGLALHWWSLTLFGHHL